MSCNNPYINCPAIPLSQVVRRVAVISSEGAGWYIDLLYRPTEAVVNCDNSNIPLSQLIGQTIVEHESDGLPVFRAYACY